MVDISEVFVSSCVDVENDHHSILRLAKVEVLLLTPQSCSYPSNLTFCYSQRGSKILFDNQT